jgi:hypothetical protein
MKLQRIGHQDPVNGDLYWFHDASLATVRHAVSGPFRDRWAAYKWLIDHTEEKLSPEKKALWGEALQLAGSLDADVAHLLGLIALVAHGRPREYVWKCAKRPPHWGIGLETQTLRHA